MSLFVHPIRLRFFVESTRLLVPQTVLPSSSSIASSLTSSSSSCLHNVRLLHSSLNQIDVLPNKQSSFLASNRPSISHRSLSSTIPHAFSVSSSTSSFPFQVPIRFKSKKSKSKSKSISKSKSRSSPNNDDDDDNKNDSDFNENDFDDDDDETGVEVKIKKSKKDFLDSKSASKSSTSSSSSSSSPSKTTAPLNVAFNTLLYENTLLRDRRTGELKFSTDLQTQCNQVTRRLVELHNFDEIIAFELALGVTRQSPIPKTTAHHEQLALTLAKTLNVQPEAQSNSDSPAASTSIPVKLDSTSPSPSSSSTSSASTVPSSFASKKTIPAASSSSTSTPVTIRAQNESILGDKILIIIDGARRLVQRQEMIEIAKKRQMTFIQMSPVGKRPVVAKLISNQEAKRLIGQDESLPGSEYARHERARQSSTQSSSSSPDRQLQPHPQPPVVNHRSSLAKKTPDMCLLNPSIQQNDLAIKCKNVLKKLKAGTPIQFNIDKSSKSGQSATFDDWKKLIEKAEIIFHPKARLERLQGFAALFVPLSETEQRQLIKDEALKAASQAQKEAAKAAKFDQQQKAR